MDKKNKPPQIDWSYWKPLLEHAKWYLRRVPDLSNDDKYDLGADLVLDFLESGKLKQALDSFDPSKTETGHQRLLKNHVAQKLEWFIKDRRRKNPTSVETEPLEERIFVCVHEGGDDANDEFEVLQRAQINFETPEQGYEAKQRQEEFKATLSPFAREVYERDLAGESTTQIALALKKAAASIHSQRNRTLGKAEKFFDETMGSASGYKPKALQRKKTLYYREPTWRKQLREPGPTTVITPEQYEGAVAEELAEKPRDKNQYTRVYTQPAMPIEGQDFKLALKNCDAALRKLKLSDFITGRPSGNKEGREQ